MSGDVIFYTRFADMRKLHLCSERTWCRSCSQPVRHLVRNIAPDQTPEIFHFRGDEYSSDCAFSRACCIRVGYRGFRRTCGKRVLVRSCFLHGLISVLMKPCILRMPASWAGMNTGVLWENVRFRSDLLFESRQTRTL